VIDATRLVELYNHLCCLTVIAIYLAIGIGLVSSRPAKKRKRSGVWTQNDSQGNGKK
jgi:hypothetical protein